jgi:hypothetical protein
MQTQQQTQQQPAQPQQVQLQLQSLSTPLAHSSVDLLGMTQEELQQRQQARSGGGRRAPADLLALPAEALAQLYQGPASSLGGGSIR